MLLLKTEKLPESQDVIYELKLDGYRAIAFKSGGRVCIRSRNDNDFACRYRSIAKALQAMPDETVIDGEVVAGLPIPAIPPVDRPRIPCTSYDVRGIGRRP